jgi:hypothetical protein
MKTPIAILFLTSGLMAADVNQQTCAQHAQTTANRKGLYLDRSHYNPKFGQCFMITHSGDGRYTTFEDPETGNVLANEHHDPKEPTTCRIWIDRGWVEKSCVYMRQFVAVRMEDADAADNTWQRQQECAVQAEKIRQQDVPDGSIARVHYSPKYQRCFAYFYELSGEFGAFPYHSYFYLYDAFEHNQLTRDHLVMMDRNEKKEDCELDYKKTACSVMWDYVKERLNN